MGVGAGGEGIHEIRNLLPKKGNFCLHKSTVKSGDSPAFSVVRKLKRKSKKRSTDSKSFEDLGIGSVVYCKM